MIAYGKVLGDDAKAINEYSIKDGDFIVAMQQKAKPAPKPKPAEAPKEDPKPATTNAQPSGMPVQPNP